MHFHLVPTFKAANDELEIANLAILNELFDPIPKIEITPIVIDHYFDAVFLAELNQAPPFLNCQCERFLAPDRFRAVPDRGFDQCGPRAHISANAYQLRAKLPQKLLANSGLIRNGEVLAKTVQIA